MEIDQKEKKIIKQYINNGFVINKIKNLVYIEKIKKKFINLIKKSPNFKKVSNDEDLFNNTHKYLNVKNLNNFRLNIFNRLSKDKEFKTLIYKLSKEFLDILVGNELAMQTRPNLSIQLPKDNSSLLPVHADTWSGVSPFEVVVWLPLVNCFKSKSMYILPTKKFKKIQKKLFNKKLKSSKEVFNLIKKDLIWLNVNYGEVLIFDQSLPHGNIVNNENETRWSINTRFKGLFTPYGDKKLGEFFEPVTIKAASSKGMNYSFPIKLD